MVTVGGENLIARRVLHCRPSLPSSLDPFFSSMLRPMRRLSRVTESLAGRGVLLTGPAQGAGRALALRFAREGAHVALLCAARQHPRTDSAMWDLAEEVERSGGRAVLLKADLRDEDEARRVVRACEAKLGAVDALINNAAALHIGEAVTTKQFGAMLDASCRGTLSMIRACIPLLAQSSVGHVVSVSPPLKTCTPKWMERNPTYSVSKFGMSMLTLAYSAEVRCNTLWPHRL